LGLLARNPADSSARAGLAEVHERLLARAENALLEERLDEAAAASKQRAIRHRRRPHRILDGAARKVARTDQNAQAQIQQQSRARTEPQSTAALDAKRALASGLLEEARSAIDRREFAHAAALIDSAMASPLRRTSSRCKACSRRAQTSGRRRLGTASEECQ